MQKPLPPGNFATFDLLKNSPASLLFCINLDTMFWKALLGTLLFTFILSYILPWWIASMVAAIMAFLFPLRHLGNFWAGSLAVALVWGSYALFLTSNNDFILSTKMGALFGGVGAVGMLMLTLIIGGLLGGLGAWVGKRLRLLFQT